MKLVIAISICVSSIAAINPTSSPTQDDGGINTNDLSWYEICGLINQMEVENPRFIEALLEALPSSSLEEVHQHCPRGPSKPLPDVYEAGPSGLQNNVVEPQPGGSRGMQDIENEVNPKPLTDEDRRQRLETEMKKLVKKFVKNRYELQILEQRLQRALESRRHMNEFSECPADPARLVPDEQVSPEEPEEMLRSLQGMNEQFRGLLFHVIMQKSDIEMEIKNMQDLAKGQGGKLTTTEIIRHLQNFNQELNILNMNLESMRNEFLVNLGLLSRIL
ncbi:hypothetical protein QAD02_009004 [Eretmocerus hayati]|uniref:Uncharacterized protein n=1 Tax=Eretmocerus hayati TaxID=131215 RepID=A0ACC2N8F1_9HYME|nr:hypothetical protein QAD02_009004 [Eretmocerus hayati]